MLGAAFTPEQPVRIASAGICPAAPALVCPALPPKREPGPCDPGQKHTPEQCPDLDDDHDGIINSKDECPLEPGPLATHGCPDRDGDGVPDKYDNCPDEPGPASNQGCPVTNKQTVVITKQQLEIKQKVYFDIGKTVVLPRSFGLLDDVARVIKAHPEMAIVVGPDRPIAPNATAPGRARNRRVEFRLGEQQPPPALPLPAPAPSENP